MVADAIQAFNRATYPGGLSLQTAWLGIYQTLLWYEPVNWVGFTALPHIIDANNLRQSSPQRARSWRQPSAWQQRASSMEIYLAQQLGCLPAAVSHHVDMLMKLPMYAGMQRQNFLGTAFSGLVKHVLETFGSQAVEYELEVDANVVFPGIVFPGRSTTPKIDLLVRSQGIPRAIISAKWSLRHDRLSDITNECPIYKDAFNRIHRARGVRFPYFVLTNEYSPSRLLKILHDPCVDELVHVHKEAIIEVCKLDGRLSRMLDLSDFVGLSQDW